MDFKQFNHESAPTGLLNQVSIGSSSTYCQFHVSAGARLKTSNAKSSVLRPKEQLVKHIPNCDLQTHQSKRDRKVGSLSLAHLFWELGHRGGPIPYIISSEDGISVMSDLQMRNERLYCTTRIIS